MDNDPIFAWELRDVTKRFPGVVANDRIGLRLSRGRIHGLVGENGSGKSTLIKTLCGVHQPNEGSIIKDGEPVAFADPIDARRAGIATVFQEFSLVPTLTVAENVSLGHLPRRGPWIDWKETRARASRVLAEIGADIDADTLVADLSIAGQQLVEIAKAIAANASLIILDEPTTALGIEEIAVLHRLLRRLRGQGRTILYISHRLDEVVELVDDVTVIKDGRIASAAGETEVSIAAIVNAMVGRVDEHYPKERNATAEILLEARAIRTGNRVVNTSLTLHRGEVLGLGGVLGSGRTEIARALFGVDRLTAGSLNLSGQRVRFRRARDAITARIALVPENRKFDGLFFNFSGLANISIAALGRLTGSGFLDRGRERDIGRGLITQLRVTPAAEQLQVGQLSGGNQQKIVIARWLFAEAEVFILDEPTQGIDVGAKIAVYNLINDLTRAGRGIILISTDYDELLAMSDRIAIVSHGQVVATRPAGALTKSDLVRASARLTETAA